MKTLAMLFLAVTIWGVGLLTFADRAARSTPAKDPPPADAIVVLTGASTLRLETGIHLLEDGKGARVLLSGVNLEATRADIQDVTKAGQKLYDCCVDLGFSATDTVGNGRETAAWADQHGYMSLIVVTAAYHMPRAMLELRATLKPAGVRLQTYAVPTPALKARRWWRSPGAARLMVVEYSKYLAILGRETMLGLGPRDAPAQQTTSQQKAST